MAMVTNRTALPTREEVPQHLRPEFYSGGMRYLVNGEVCTWKGKGIEVKSPILFHHNEGEGELTLGRIPFLGPAEAEQVLQAAGKAYAAGMGEWPRATVEERLQAMQGFVQRIQPWEEEFSRLEMWEIAKPYAACLDEFRRTVQYIQDSMESLRELEKQGDELEKSGDFLYQVRRFPLGVTLCLGPFNYPLNETMALVIPALLMGNTLIIKAPDRGALCTQPLLEAFAASFPPGVVNILTGDGPTLVTPIMESGQVAVLGFIGSSPVARKIIAGHPAPNRLRTILGLEAKNPAFIFPDADLEHTVKECLNGALEFNGQRCTSLKHIWVHEKAADRFLDDLGRAVGQATCGMPWEEEVLVTPLAEPNKVQWLTHLVEEACSKGARIVNPGGGQSEGNLFYPAVLYPVTEKMKIYHVEQFGPVIPVSPFRDLEELKSYLARSQYGQQASIFTSSAEYAAPLIDILANQVARINLNAQCRRSPDELPFTGRKDSAEGTLSVGDALEAFSLRSLVVANQPGRELFMQVLSSRRSQFLQI